MTHELPEVQLQCQALEVSGPDWGGDADGLRYAVASPWQQAAGRQKVASSITGHMTDKWHVSPSWHSPAGLAPENVLKDLLLAQDPGPVDAAALDKRLKSCRLLDPAVAVPDLNPAPEESQFVDVVQQAIPYRSGYPLPLKLEWTAAEHAISDAQLRVVERLRQRVRRRLCACVFQRNRPSIPILAVLPFQRQPSTHSGAVVHRFQTSPSTERNRLSALSLSSRRAAVRPGVPPPPRLSLRWVTTAPPMAWGSASTWQTLSETHDGMQRQRTAVVGCRNEWTAEPVARSLRDGRDSGVGPQLTDHLDSCNVCCDAKPVAQPESRLNDDEKYETDTIETSATDGGARLLRDSQGCAPGSYGSAAERSILRQPFYIDSIGAIRNTVHVDRYQARR